MTHRATQPISSAFGSYMPGDHIDEAAAPVIDAWVAAGIVEPVPSDQEETAVPEEETAPKPERAEAPKVEKATAPKRERAVGRRMQTEATPHRRFVQDAEKAER